MADNKNVEVDSKQLQNAQDLWENFTEASKYTIYAICTILILLALAFVKFF